jgi:6-phosphogluconolactonase
MTAATRTIRRFADREVMCQNAASDFQKRSGDAIRARSRFVVALSGGSTPKRLFEILAAAPFHDSIDWPNVVLFWGDERPVPPDHADSNYRMARESLISKVSVRPENVHRMVAEAADGEQSARAYEEQIRKSFGVSSSAPPPAFDLVLLGMGPDGHTASLFPETTALDEQQRLVTPNFVPKFNSRRMTFTYPLINAARQVLFLVGGGDKAETLRDVLVGPEQVHKYPSQGIQPTSGELFWFVDADAAALLPAGVCQDA